MSDRDRSLSPLKSDDESRKRRNYSSDEDGGSPKRKKESYSGEDLSKEKPTIRVREGIKHVFVGPTGRRMGNNIEYYANEKELEEIFSVYGEVDTVKVRSNTKDVFAFVHFKDSDSAARAIENMNGKDIKRMKVKVDWGSYNGNRSAPRRLPPGIRHRSPARDYGRKRYRSPRPRYYRRRSPSPRYERRRSPPRYERRRSPPPRYAERSERGGTERYERRRSPSPRYERRRSPSPRYERRRSPSPRYAYR